MIIMTKVLFVVKCRDLPYLNERPVENYSYCMTSGLLNSASLVSEMLNNNGIESKVVQVIDNNQIDREVSLYKPTHVMIEALWVVSEKFKILQKLHPHVKWVIRIHSEIPFAANEGIAVQWLNEYIVKKNVYIAPNSKRLYRDLENYFKASMPFIKDKLIYLPNHYEKERVIEHEHNHRVLNVGCFGAVRPLKNQLLQAYAAIEYARRVDKKLRFHINSQRVEQNGNPVLSNIRALFAGLNPSKYELVEHKWLKHEHFIREVRKMDICLQVSFSETFNITTSDAVSQGIPVVVSDEVDWVSSLFKAKTGDTSDIVSKMGLAITLGKFGSYLNFRGLINYNRDSVKMWLHYLKKHSC